jgi:hypothetical protein
LGFGYEADNLILEKIILLRGPNKEREAKHVGGGVEGGGGGIKNKKK